MEPASIEAEQVFQRARRGDRGAFAQLVHAHESMVFSLLLHATHDRASAEEIAQDIFLSLYRHMQKLECSAHVTSWLRRTAVHRTIDHLRREKHRPKVRLEDAPEPAAEAKADDPFMRERLREATAELPDKARMVVILRYQEEMELNEIAQTMDIPLNTVKSQLHRALAALRGKLEKARVEL